MKLAAALLILLAQIAIPAPVGASQWGGWSDRFFLSGPDGPIETMLVHDGNLIVGGRFSGIGSVHAPGVARFDGMAWSALGEGIQGVVHVLGEYRGDLIAGGRFSEAGGVAASNIAQWDGSAWHPLGGGTTSSVHSLAEFEGSLIAGGTFGFAGGASAWHVARWDGTQWHAMGDGIQERVVGLAVYDGTLFAGSFGLIRLGDHDRYAYVWRWDGTSWSLLTTSEPFFTWGVRPDLVALRVIKDRLWAIGGSLAVDDGHFGTCFWDGASWHQGLPGPRNATWHYEEEWESAVLPYQDGIIVGGAFWGPGNGTCHSIALHRGSGMEPLPGGGLRLYEESIDSAPSVSALVEYRGEVFVAGHFLSAGAAHSPLLARWNGTEWGAPGPTGDGIAGTVKAIAFWGDRLIVGGSFTSAGGLPVWNIAVFDREGWHPLGAGLPLWVDAVVPYRDGIVAAGPFRDAGGVAVNGIARWDGATWHAMGSGLQDGYVHDLIVFEGDLVAGGRFGRSGDIALKHVARWNGDSWQPMGAGIDGTVHALELHEGELIAGAGSSAGVLRWDGNEWVPLGPGLQSNITQLQSTPRGLYASTNAGLRLWNGSRWNSLETPAGEIRTMAALSGRPVMGGRLGPDRATSLMRFDGTTWRSFDEAPQLGVEVVASNGLDLAVGGWFRSTGERPSWGLALWEGIETAVPPISVDARRIGATIEISCAIPDSAAALRYLIDREVDGTRIRLTQTPLTGSPNYQVVDLTPPLDEVAYWCEQISRAGDRIAEYGPFRVASTEQLWPLGRIRVSPVPARDMLRISFTLPRQTGVRIDIVDPIGRLIASPWDAALGPGEVDLSWDGRGVNGHRVGAGVYWVVLRAGRQTRASQLVWQR